MKRRGIYLIFIFLSSLCLSTCDNLHDSGSLKNNKTLFVTIQPLGDFPKELTYQVYKELQKIHSTIIINRNIEIPLTAYYAPRNRYRADSLIRDLLHISPEGHVTIALTDKDISTTKGNIQDYGIMGLGYQPGRSCVVSTFRLKKENLPSQLFKVSIHELGHTQGLPHCPVKNCFMRDAEGKNHLEEETGFCQKCTAHLISRGWNLKK